MALRPAAAVPATSAPAADAVVPTERWDVDLSRTGGLNARWADGGLRLADRAPRAVTSAALDRHAPVAEGAYLSPEQALTRPATRVRAEVAADAGPDAEVEVQVRGWRAAGWTEWRTAGPAAVFDQPVTRVQARVLLTARAAGATLAVRAVQLTADRAAVAAATPGRSYRVYATRIGLVGQTTANGHVVTSRDHFAALPSRRSLSPLGTGDYTVRVCTTSGSRCEYAPVWDVGPWNTRDDYWNPSAVRENWKDLPQGRPEAQAAYQDGYHGGRDQFGRTVLNPGGVDLADGTFWDGLQLTGNAWVDVAYLWTGTGPHGVVGSGPLNLRAGPGTGYAARGLAATYAHVPIECYVTGQTVSGPYRTTNRWNRLASGQYVSHAYISAVYGGTAPRC
ncbi:hypothetical protein OOK41_26465 [Micromonospora sp. NBC_01655]|uniref:hypothetical protein n=1 Tax=Micromonospora sp. NBC_01655 TaxID=2975983 RepID=UPI002254BE6C|nr:hypothetical protein [Micromonospora sp. NBC_01655]MCX4473807.1 hypothetical protein [Micromonospora sp. NBC_01655]